MPTLTKFERKLLARPTVAFHSFNDVFSEVHDKHGIPQDFDAELTSLYRHLLFPNIRTTHGIGDDIVRGAYGVELVAGLVDSVWDDITKKVAETNKYGLPFPKNELHGDLRMAKEKLESGAVRVVANIAARNAENRLNNGANFYLAILDNGVEVYATPPGILRYVAHRIVSLFEIPNENNPLFDGQREQFRSSIIGRSGHHPSHLVNVYRVDPSQEKPSEEDLKKLREFIPEQRHKMELAYVDKYGNCRVRVKQKYPIFKTIKQMLDKEEKGQVKVQVGEGQVQAHLVSSLTEIPEAEWGFYSNSADIEDFDSLRYWNAPWYRELVLKSYDKAKHAQAYEDLGRPSLGSEVILPEDQELKLDSPAIIKG